MGVGSETAVASMRLTSPGRVLWPGQGVTKLALARYYEAVAPWILPHVARRPLTLVRCPRGSGAPCFYQKHPGDQVPDLVGRVEIEERKGVTEYAWVDSAQGLIALVQIGTLEIHVWGSHVDRVERPDVLVFDLDPDPAVSWPRVAEAARALHDRLLGLGLRSWVKTTGGKGLHVVVPIARRHEFDDAKEFSRAVAERMVADDPAGFVATMSKARRKDRIFVDWLRNGRGATAIAPYSSRAREGAPVAMPIGWDELADGVDPGAFTVATVPALLDQRPDPWREILSIRQSITQRVWAALRE
jgi:bifunctional non-homologous end joining protein LigD